MRIGIIGGYAQVTSSVLIVVLIVLLLCICRPTRSTSSTPGPVLGSKNATISLENNLSEKIRFRFNGSDIMGTEEDWARTKKVLSRKRRSVVQLAGMLRCVTGCNPLSYKGYGCYCGYMGAGYPMDEIDRCCLEHDWCYTHISCPQFLIYFIPYEWSCLGPGYPQCEIGNMGNLPAECALQLCECDRAFARCVRKFPCPKSKLGCIKRTFMPRIRGIG